AAAAAGIIVDVRTGQGPGKLDRAEFTQRFRAHFDDPAFDDARDSIAALEAIAWDAYQHSRKAPRTRPAGEEFSDPTYELSLDWIEARERLKRAAARHDDTSAPSR